MADDLVYAATAWETNAAMIADCARLGYLKDTDYILDPTYGKGGWWRVWTPSEANVYGHARADGGAVLTGLLRPAEMPVPMSLGDFDFRAMPYPDAAFDAVAFDPPYVSVGGRETTGIHMMHDAFGMGDTPTTPQGVQDDINAGLRECYRVVRRGGIVLCKCQSYVTSGKLFPGLFLTWQAATEIGFQLVDHLVHVSGPRPQPSGRLQQHARRNQSDLLVLRSPKRGA